MFVTCTFQGTAVGSSLWLLPSQPEKDGIVTIDRIEQEKIGLAFLYLIKGLVIARGLALSHI